MEGKLFSESPYPIPIRGEEIKEFIKEMPSSPGVYKFLDEFDKPLYIGKAKLLNKRIASYFRQSSRSNKIIKLLQQSKDITGLQLNNNSKLVYSVKKLKSPLSKKLLFIGLADYFDDEEEINKVIENILNKRTEKTMEKIERK